MKKKNLVILGSSGSIGTSALEVVRQFKERFNVVGLSVNANVEVLKAQIKEFKPSFVAVGDADKAHAVSKDLKNGPMVLASREGICQLARLPEADLVLVSIVGTEAVFPLLSAIRSGKTIALANKEAVVIAGALVRSEAKKYKATIIPVDSEQSAIFQCLQGRDPKTVAGLLLTASGGPLIDYSKKRLRDVSLNKVLKHPRWRMGKKITVDSATLMNKGLEVIEARGLFDISLDKIKVLIHRQALVHSLVEFIDGSMLAQMAVTDMKLPIQVALSYPERWLNEKLRLAPRCFKRLSFEEPDTDRFPCLRLAFEAGRLGGCAPCALNAANEVAVDAFIEGRLAFGRIPFVVEDVLKKGKWSDERSSLDGIFEADWQARALARQKVLAYARKGTKRV